MQTVLEQGSIDKPLTFDVGLIQLSFIPVCSPFSQIATFQYFCLRYYLMCRSPRPLYCSALHYCCY